MIYHYSKAANLQNIISDGLLKPTDLFVPPPERPVLWFSSNQEWETTVSAAMTLDHAILTFGGLLRFGVTNKPTLFISHWSKLWKKAKISKDQKEILEMSAKKVGSDPYQWYGRFTPLPLEQVDLIEYVDPSDAFEDEKLKWRDITNELERVSLPSYIKVVG